MAGYEVEVVRNAEDSLHLLGPDDRLLLCIEEGAADKIDKIAEVPPETADKIMLWLDHVAALPRAARTRTGTFLFGGESEHELALAVRKHLDQNLFGLERYLAEGTQLQRLSLSDSTRRGEALDLIEQFNTGLGLDARIISQILTVADEFITNAFYHAPIDESGRHRFSHLSRIDPVQCPEDHPIEVSYAFDGRSAAVAVSDRFGSFDPKALLRHFGRVLSSPKVNSGAGGAGLGLFISYQASTQLIFNIAARHRTECIGILEASGNYRKFVEQPKSFHLFNGAHPQQP